MAISSKPKGKKAGIILITVVIFLLIIAVSVLVFLYGCNSGKKVPSVSGIHTGLYVDGTVLREADGTEFLMRGVNHSHCWYRDMDETALDAIMQTGANCVRLVLSCGDRWDKDSKENVSQLLEMTKSRGMIAILEVHDATGSDDISGIGNITDFWVEMAEVLEETEAYCIVNIANEWVGSWNSELWKEGYLEAIPRLRNAGIKNVLLIDAAGWGQYGRSIRRDGYEVFMADSLKNTMFSVHMYGISAGTRFAIRYNLKGATNQNLCVTVGEFGYKHSDGDVKEDYLMQYCEDNSIGYMAWSWKGNSGGVEYLDLSNDWTGSDLTADWGYKVVYGENGIRRTSQKANIFK